MKIRQNHRMRIICGVMTVVMLLCCFAGCSKSKTVDEPDALLQESTVAAETEETVLTTEETLTTAEETTQAETLPEETTAEPETEKETEAETTEAQPEQKAPQTKAEILAYFNESMNRIKPEAKSVTTNYVLNTQTSDATLSNKMLQNIANKLISANMGYDTKQQGLTLSTSSERNAKFPVRGQTWSSKLTEADISSATCTEKDGKYIIEIHLIPDTTPNIGVGQGHAGKAFSFVTKDQIVEGAGSLGMSVIQEDSIKLTFKDCRIKATIDKETGHVTDANYYQDWTLSLTALGIDVSVSFGAEDDYTIHW